MGFGPDTFLSEAMWSLPLPVQSMLSVADSLVTGAPRNINQELKSAIDKALLDISGTHLLSSFYGHLKDRYDITPDELPYRLETIYTVLDQVFGVKGARTIERHIAKHLCDELGMKFLDTPDCTLEMYVEKAKQLS